MNDRPTKTFTTASGVTVVFYTYLKAREFRPIAEDTNLSNADRTHRFLEAEVIEIDGSSEDVGNKLLDLPVADYASVIEAVMNTINPTTPSKSSTPGTDTSSTAL